jgi:putative ABC transport system permease protein
VRTNLPVSQASDAVRKAVMAVDARQPLSDMRTMDWVISSAVARQQFNLLLMGVFAAIALLLAAVGIYGVVSYQVGQRARELGIRVALGATRGQILRVVVGQGLKPIAAGLLAGLIATLALTRLIQALLYQVSPRDPWTIAAISAVLAAVACLACYVPARRATKIDPIAALRCE